MKKVPTDKKFAVRGEALKKMMEEDKAAGLIPFFVGQQSLHTVSWPQINGQYNLCVMSLICETSACSRVWLAALTCGLVSCSSAPPLAPLHHALLIASPSWGQYVSQHGCKCNVVTERVDFTVCSSGLCHKRTQIGSSHTRHAHPNCPGGVDYHRYEVCWFYSCSFLFPVFSR